jgi:hypothetical protein
MRLTRRLLRCGSKLMHVQAQLILYLVRDGETWDTARLVRQGSHMRLEMKSLGGAELAKVAASLLLRPLVSAAAQGHYSDPSSTRRMIAGKVFCMRHLSQLRANRIINGVFRASNGLLPAKYHKCA